MQLTGRSPDENHGQVITENYRRKYTGKGYAVSILTPQMKGWNEIQKELSKSCMTLRKKTGIQFLTTHVYRHTFATCALEYGINVKALSKILGHTDVAFTMQRYCSPDVDFLREQMDMIDQVRKSRNS